MRSMVLLLFINKVENRLSRCHWLSRRGLGEAVLRWKPDPRAVHSPGRRKVIWPKIHCGPSPVADGSAAVAYFQHSRFPKT